MLYVTPTRSERELYDCAPDYLDGEEEIKAADELAAEQAAEDRDDLELMRRRGN